MLKKIVKMLMRIPENWFFCENCYIWGKAIAGTAEIFPSIVILSLTQDRKIF